MAGGKPRVSRKATKGKGKRWLKGHSCSSNPETKTFREAARNRFFQPNLGGHSDLTVDAVKKHEAVRLGDDDDVPVDADSADDLQSIGVKTFDSFASVWTSCTNPSFDRLLKNWQPSSAVNKDRLAVLAAVTEVIKSQGGKETETEYFAALMTALDTLDSEGLVTACITLIGLVMKRLSPTILKVKFSETSKVFLELLAKHVDGENPSLMKGVIGCLSVMLRAQEAAIWGNASTLQSFQIIMSFTTHSKPRVRKAAQHAVCAILKGSSLMLAANAPPHHPAASATAKFCIQLLEEHGGMGEATTSLHILGLLRNILSVFPQPSLKSCCETILQLMPLGNVLVTSCCLQAIHGMFINQPKASSLSAELNARLITALYKFQPSLNDTQPLLAWLTVMKEAHVNLIRLDEKLCLGHLARLFSVACRCWLSPKPEVCAGVTSVLKALLYDCGTKLAPKIQAVLESAPPDSVTPAHRMFESVESCLSYQYHGVWAQVFHVLAVFFEVLGAVCHPIMKKGLKSIGNMRGSANFPFANELDYAIGKAVRSMGPSVVLECIPLDFLEQDCRFERSWLLPVLRDNVCATRLGFFAEYFLPLSSRLNALANRHVAEGKLALSKSYMLLYNQIWSLLPGFCTSPTDLCESFKPVASTLGMALTNGADLRLDVMASLRILISKNLDNPENTKELARYAKNFVPILFNLYIRAPTSKEFCGEGTRLAAFDTFKVYLQITDKEISDILFDNGLAKIESGTDAFEQQAMLDLLRALLPYVDSKRTAKIYSVCLPMIQDKNRTMQKKAYRLCEELCSGKSENSRQLVLGVLPSLKASFADALSTAIPSSKTPRLRCLGHVVSQLTEKDAEFILSLIPEVIICTKEPAVKVRTTAAGLLIAIGQKLLEFGGKPEKEIMKNYVQILLAGFGGSSHMISATVISLSHVIGYFRDHVSSGVLQLVLDNVAILLLSKVREVVCAALEFLKTIISIFPDVDLAQHVQSIVQALANMTEDCKSHSRMRIRRIFQRLIRKFGVEMIQGFAPDCFRKLVTNIRKMEARDKKRHASMKDKDLDDEDGDAFSLKSAPQTIDDILQKLESDSEDDDDDARVPAKPLRKKNVKGLAWIQEGGEEIVDLLDPKASQSILATRPEVKGPIKPKDDFKIAQNGRFIIGQKEDFTKTARGRRLMIGIEDDLAEENDGKALVESVQSLLIPENSTKGTKRKLDDDDSGDEQISEAPLKYQAGGTGIHRPIKKPNPKGKSREQAYGSDYKAKRAGGDMKRRGKPDPYAYVPLNMQTLNKRKKAKFAGQFKGMVRSARKGAIRGQKSRNRRGKPK